MTAPPTCPFCDASTVERVGQWGGQIITAQWRCEACGSYFEALREELDDEVGERAWHYGALDAGFTTHGRCP